VEDDVLFLFVTMLSDGVCGAVALITLHCATGSAPQVTGKRVTDARAKAAGGHSSAPHKRRGSGL
jgi:hypothetical protein